MKTKEWIIGTVAVLTIAGSVSWTWHTQFGARDPNAGLQRAVGDRLATEAGRLASGQGTVAGVTLETGASAALDEQWRAFQARLQAVPGMRLGGVERVDGDKGDKYGPGAGLSARRLTRLVEKNRDAAVLVSFIGLPDLEEKEVAALGTTRPKLVAFSRSMKGVVAALRRGVAHAVIVPRFEFPAPGDANPSTPAGWFDQRFQVVTPETISRSQP